MPVARQSLDAELIDEIRLHLVLLVLGAATALFRGVRTDVRLARAAAINTTEVTHTQSSERTPPRRNGGGDCSNLGGR